MTSKYIKKVISLAPPQPLLSVKSNYSVALFEIKISSKYTPSKLIFHSYKLETYTGLRPLKHNILPNANKNELFSAI